MIEMGYIWDNRWDSTFKKIYEDGIETKRQGDLDGAAEHYIDNLEKYLDEELLPVFPYAILLKALGKVLTLQGRFNHAAAAYFLAIDIYIYQDVQQEIDLSLYHLGCCENSFLSTPTGLEYLSGLQQEGGKQPGSPDPFIDLNLMQDLTANGFETYQKFHRLLYKGRAMKLGWDRDHEIRYLVRKWIERYRNLVPVS